jgi:hypothetical protein
MRQESPRPLPPHSHGRYGVCGCVGNWVGMQNSGQDGQGVDIAVLLAGLGKTRSAPVIGTELLLGAGTSNRLRTRDRVANVGVPLVVIGCFFRAFIDLVSRAAAIKAKIKLATALSFLCPAEFSLASCSIQNHRAFEPEQG